MADARQRKALCYIVKPAFRVVQTPSPCYGSPSSVVCKQKKNCTVDIYCKVKKRKTVTDSLLARTVVITLLHLATEQPWGHTHLYLCGWLYRTELWYWNRWVWVISLSERSHMQRPTGWLQLQLSVRIHWTCVQYQHWWLPPRLVS